MRKTQIKTEVKTMRTLETKDICLTLMEEVLLLGLKDKEVMQFGLLGCLKDLDIGMFLRSI